MITVKFKNVGREKKSWAIQMEKLNEAALCKSVRENGRLLSSQIDCDLETGEVLVGGWGAVGKFTVHNDDKETAVAK